jgi:hypothetical protein
MPSSYDQIRAENIRGYGEHTHHLSFLGRLYSDRTHFVYELLQNAEDAGATKVEFALHAECLEIRHNGRPFNGEDVYGICGVGEGTKAEDLTKIGKFGIGFKSVYAYTSSPEIHSVGSDNREDFRINHYVRPEAVAARDPGNGWTTLIVLPFERDDVPPATANGEIAERLRGLSARTLLFLRSIEEIEYKVASGDTGIYLRETTPLSLARQVTVIGQGNGAEELESWLVFDQPLTPPDVEKHIYVEVAFKFEEDEKSKQKSVVAIPHSPLIVFFPTEKETSLGFLTQGPYRTTPARDNVPREDEWNAELIVKTAKLVINALARLKAMKLLTVAVLEAMPLDPEDFPEDGMFRPLYDEVRAAFSDKMLLPTEDGGFVMGRQAKLGRGEALRKLLPPKQLSQLYASKHELMWLSGDITVDRTPALREYLMREIGIVEITPERLALDISKEFLEAQDDDWMIEFYRFLKEQEALWRPKSWNHAVGSLRNKAIIRLEGGTHVAPFGNDDRPRAYLPDKSLSGEYPTVRTTLVKDAEAAEFLRRLGLRQVEDEDVVVKILNGWYRSETSAITEEAHLAHMKRFVSWYKKTSNLEPFTSAEAIYYLFCGRYGEKFYKARDCYLDVPYAKTDLSFVYDEERFAGDESWCKHGIWDGYAEIDGFVEFAEALGVSTNLHVQEMQVWITNPSWMKLQQGLGNPKRSSLAIDEDYTIPGLADFIEPPCKEVSLLIWRLMFSADPKVLTARYRPNANCDLREAPSTLVHILSNAKWIQGADGEFYAPNELTGYLISDAFTFEHGRQYDWLLKIGFGNDAQQTKEEYQQRQQHAQALGIKNPELIEWLKEIQDDEALIAEFKSQVEARRHTHTVAFPVRPVQDAERRSERVGERVASAPVKSYEPRTRSVRVSNSDIEPAVWLRNQYTNDEGKLVCQICHGEMPFRKRNGEHYFEAVELLSRDELPQELAVQYLALCPLCAAKYKEFVKRDPDAVAELLGKLTTTDQPEVRVHFQEEDAIIRFVETHWHDLKVVLKERHKRPVSA